MRYIESVVTLEYNEALCNGCTLCVLVCPHAVFAMENKRAVLVDRDACMECGACSRNCEQEAITVRAGVGCAGGIIRGWFKTGEATCDCGDGTAAC